MAHNVSQDEELLGILRDVATHRFHQGRQINPGSMLYQTAELATTSGYLENAVLDANYSNRLASLDLTQAKLTGLGEAKLRELAGGPSTETSGGNHGY